VPQTRVATPTNPREVPPKTLSFAALAGPSARRHAEEPSLPQNIFNQITQIIFAPTQMQIIAPIQTQIFATGTDRQSNRPDMTKALTLAEHELVRKHAETAQREKQLIEDGERLKRQVDGLQQQIVTNNEKREAGRRSTMQQQSKQAADRESQHKQDISRLEQLHFQQSKQAADMQSRNAAEEIKRLQDQVRLYKQSEAVQARQATGSGNLEKELRARRAELSKAEEDRKWNEAARRAKEAQNQHSEESEDDSDSDESGDDQDLLEPCLSCAKSHAAICALRHELGGKGLGGSKMQFLARLDPARSADELVVILCVGLRDFLHIHEKHSRDIEAKLRDADVSIADYKDKLAESSCKVSGLENQLDKARAKLKKARANVK
jgi:hypothetical protein